VFWAYVWIDGIRHHKSTGTPNRRRAELVEQQFKEELNLRRHHLKELEPNLSFGGLAARFLADGSKAWHVDRLKVLLPYFADVPIARISKSTVREYRQRRHREKRLTDTTVNRDLECLRHILFWAVDEGLLLANPLSRMRLERERKRKRPVLSLGEEDRLLGAAALHLRPIILAALDAGMRRGELLTQRWEDVDFARRLLFVTHSKTPEGESREIPLTARLFDLLWEMRENEGPIFTFKGQAIRSIKTAWKKALSRTEIRRYRFHDLRHTFNTRLMEAGVIREVRMSLMGHSLGDDPQATYTHVELPLKRDGIRKLELWTAEQRTQLSLEEPRKGGSSDGARKGEPGTCSPSVNADPEPPARNQAPPHR
jgi:integrase